MCPSVHANGCNSCNIALACIVDQTACNFLYLHQQVISCKCTQAHGANAITCSADLQTATKTSPAAGGLDNKALYDLLQTQLSRLLEHTRTCPLACCLQVLHAEGAREVYACATHAVLSPPATQRLSSGVFQEVIITNTIPVKPEDHFPELTVLSVANLLGETIWRVYNASSVQSIL